MNSRPPGDRADYETAINALVDGELDAVAAAELKAAAADDRVLAQAIVDAWRLQKGLDELRLERAPSTLRRALKRIPGEQSRAGATSAWPRRLAAGAFASVVLVAFAMMMATSKERPATGGPAAGELARVEAARRDLAIAFHYLDKVGGRTGERIQNVLHEQVAEPVTEQISRPFRCLASLLPPAAEGGCARLQKYIRSTPLGPLAALAHPTGVGASPAAPPYTEQSRKEEHS